MGTPAKPTFYKSYVHSGGMGQAGWLGLLLPGFLAAPGIGALYGLLLLYNPVHSITPFFTLLFSGLTGFIGGIGSDWGQVRKPRLTLIVGFLTGSLMIYVAWIVWIRATSDFSRMVFLPSEIYSLLEGLAQGGTWKILGWQPTGQMLIGIWIAEWLLASTFCALMAWGVIGKVPFCEQCNKWLEAGLQPMRLVPDQRFQVLFEQLSKGDLSALMKQKAADRSASFYTQLELKQCPGCDFFACLNLHQVYRYENEKGKMRIEDEILENFIISPGDYEKLKNKFWNGRKTK